MKAVITLILTFFALVTHAQGSGALDITFGLSGSGKVIIEHNLGTIPPTGEGDEYGRVIHVYADDSMLIGGHAYYTNEQNIDMVVTKLSSTGGIVTSWGVNGHVVVGFDLGGDNQDYLYDIQVDSNGSIYLIGEAGFSGDDTDFAIAKLTSAGVLDTSFSIDGKMTVWFDNGGSDADVAVSGITTSNSIFVVGYATQTTGTDFAMTRVLANGTIDTNFGSNGRKIIDFSNSNSSIDKAYRLFNGNQTSGFWVVGSADENNNSTSPAIARLDDLGNLLTTFSNDGKFVYSDSRTGTTITDVAQHPLSDDFVFVGSDLHPENTNLKDDCAVTYINTASTTNGEPTADTFNFNLDPNPFLFDFNSDCTSAKFSDSDSKLLLTGNLYPDNLSSFSMGVMRLNSINVTSGSSSHSIDTNFGTGGRQAISFGGTGQVIDSPSAIAIDTDKKVILVGTATNQNAVQKIAAARFIGNGGQNPTVTITLPTNGTIVVEDNITFTGVATDVEDGTISNSINWRSNIDGFLNNGATISTPSNFSPLSVGIHLITAKITDSNGQSDTDSIAIEVIEFQNDPVVFLYLPEDNSTYVEGANIRFFASANDDEDGEITTSLTWNSSIDGGLGNGGEISSNSLSIGQHTITATVIDSNNQSDSDQITVTITAAPNDPPVVVISTPTDNASFIQGENVMFSATANDTEDGDISAAINWFSATDGALGSSGMISTNQLTLGEHTITAQVFDSNNQSGFQQITININQPANALPVVIISSPVDNSTFSQGENIIFVATANDMEDGNLTSSITWFSSVEGTIGTGETFSSSTLSVGEHTITAQVFDSNNQVGFQQITINVNLTSDAFPVVTITNPNHNASFLQGSNITFFATAVDTEDGDIAANIIWDSSLDGNFGTGSTVSINSLSVGNHTITASITDSNNQTETNQISIIVLSSSDLIFKNGFE